MKGSCHCGAVRYQVTGPLREVVGCHCTQCRKTSGHYVAATQARKDDLKLTVDGGLKWYVSSPGHRRGFCDTCGSSLFWHEDGSDHISIMAGTLDGPAGLKMDRQIHVHTKGDYYDLPEAEVIDQSALKFR